MTKRLQTVAFVFAFALSSTALARMQEPEKKPAAAPKPPAPAASQALKVQIVLARYQGEKKISSMPYTLSVLAGRPANLRMGTRVPVMMVTATTTPKEVPQVGPIQYQDVGTNIDCTVTALEDGRYALTLTIDDSSVYPEEQSASHGNPSFRSFRASNAMVLRGGETAQFTAATDKVTGETVKVDVTLTVMK